MRCEFENRIVALVGDTAPIIYATFVSILNNMYRMLVITVYLAMEEKGRGQKEVKILIDCTNVLKICFTCLKR